MYREMCTLLYARYDYAYIKINEWSTFQKLCTQAPCCETASCTGKKHSPPGLCTSASVFLLLTRLLLVGLRKNGF
jgi:hypothetical protein